MRVKRVSNLNTYELILRNPCPFARLLTPNAGKGNIITKIKRDMTNHITHDEIKD